MDTKYNRYVTKSQENDKPNWRDICYDCHRGQGILDSRNPFLYIDFIVSSGCGGAMVNENQCQPLER